MVENMHEKQTKCDLLATNSILVMGAIYPP